MNTVRFNVFSVFWLVPIFTISIWIDQSDFIPFITLYAISFGAYLILLNEVRNYDGLFKKAVLLSIIGRVMLIPLIPNLSDDIYRFIWDGELMLQGVNPYLFTPNEIPVDIVGSMPEKLLKNMNSADYYSVYPPVCQLIFAFGAFISGGSLLVFSAALGVLFFMADMGVIKLLKSILDKLELPPSNLFLYSLNPLILLELHLNLHFELIMVSFFAASIYMLAMHRHVKSAIALGVAIGTKLIPVLILPFIQKQLGWGRGLNYILTALFTFTISFIPFWHEDFTAHYSESLDLYFRTFEYNASIYYIARWIGFQIEGYNLISIIGPLLSIFAASLILFLWLRQRINIPFIKMLSLFSLSITIYLFFSTTVHPWYLSIPIFLLPFTKHEYVLAWSGVIMFSYAGYMRDPVDEVTWLLVSEYVVVALFFVRSGAQGIFRMNRS